MDKNITLKIEKDLQDEVGKALDTIRSFEEKLGVKVKTAQVRNQAILKLGELLDEPYLRHYPIEQPEAFHGLGVWTQGLIFRSTGRTIYSFKADGLVVEKDCMVQRKHYTQSRTHKHRAKIKAVETIRSFYK